MKLELVFLLACGVIVSQQRHFSSYNDWQGYGGWSNPYPMSPANRRYVISDDMVTDFKEYLFARSQLNWRRSEPFGSNIEVVHQPSQTPQENDDLNAGWNIQSRSRAGSQFVQNEMAHEPANPRFFLNIVSTLGASSAYNNPLLKTIYYFTTATATTCVSTSCIPDSLFKDSSSTIICRRRRSPEYMHELGEPLDAMSLSPSVPETVHPTALVQEDSFSKTDVSATPDVLMSSKEQIEDQSKIGAARDKRFLYNYFYVSTTITTYSFVTTTVTISLSNLAGAGELSCRPSTLNLCF